VRDRGARRDEPTLAAIVTAAAARHWRRW
jgi:hypothetical protein